MNIRKIISLDDNEITQFYNKDVVYDTFGNIEIVALNDPSEFISKIIDLINPEDSILMLLDINMPNYSGFDVLEAIEEQFNELNNFYVIILTSSNLKSDIEKSSRFPHVINYIEKPLTIEKLKKSLNGFQV